MNPEKVMNRRKGISVLDPGVKNTTLVQHVPYSAIHGNKEAQCDAVIARMRETHYISKRTIPDKDTVNRIRLAGFQPGPNSTTVGPVLQLISLRIHNVNTNLLWDFKISGQISITDDFNNCFYLYKNDDHQDIFRENNKVFLSCAPIAPVTRGKLCYNLKTTRLNRKNRLPNFSGVADVDYAAETNEMLSLRLSGGQGFFAVLLFTKIDYALIVRLDEMYLFHTPQEEEEEEDHEKESTFGVYGTISVNGSLAFCVNKTEPVKITRGKGNRLCQFRTVFAVPAFRKLEVEAVLYGDDGSLIFSETMNIIPSFPFPCDLFDVEYDSRQDKSLQFVMSVDWFLQNKFFVDYHEELKATWNPDFTLDPKIIRPSRTVDVSPGTLVEVFSVVVGTCKPSRAPPVIFGKIIIQDAEAENYVFLRNKDRPDILASRSRGIVSLSWPSTDDGWIAEKDFFMHFKLEDVEGKRVCVGSFEIPSESCYSTPYTTYYDRGMCDFIKGEDGYFVAVHYSIYKNGKKARVCIKWKGCDSIVYGRVVAKYGNYRYLSAYEEMYKSIIFKRSEEDCVEVSKNSELPLSKSRVSTSSDCSKITLIVNLFYHPFTESASSGPCKINCEIELEAGMDEKVEDLENILVEVKWF